MKFINWFKQFNWEMLIPDFGIVPVLLFLFFVLPFFESCTGVFRAL